MKENEELVVPDDDGIDENELEEIEIDLEQETDVDPDACCSLKDGRGSDEEHEEEGDE